MFANLTQQFPIGYTSGLKNIFIFVTASCNLFTQLASIKYNGIVYRYILHTKDTSGDVACFACLLDKYSRPIHSLILKVVRSQEEAEELAQDTFMKVFKNLASFKGDCSFSTWIYRIAYNTAISSVRKKRYEFLPIEETTLENVSEEEVTNLFGQTESTEQVQRLEVALEQLLPDERALILLFYWKEKTIEELVSITGLTASNIKVKLHRIRKNCLYY